MKIKNYKAIEHLEFQLKKINIIYGLNGIGKTTIKSLLFKKVNNENIEHVKNINYLKEETIIEINEISNHKSIIFDENFVRDMVYKSDNLVGSNKYNVLFSKEELDNLKNDTTGYTERCQKVDFALE